MRTKYLFIVAVMLAATFSCFADIRYVEGSFRSTNAADIQTSANDLGRKNMTEAFADYMDVSDGSLDETGQHLKRGILRISFKNMANEDIRDKVSVHAGNFAVSKPSYVVNPATNMLECWVQIDPYDNLTVDVSVEGIGSARIPNVNIQGKHMYTLDVESDETVTVSFTTNVDGTKVTFDNVPLGTVSVGNKLTKERVSLGKHLLTIQTDKHTKTEEIEVSKTNTSFPLDMKRRYTVPFSSNEGGVNLYENGKLLATLPATLEVTEGPHSFTISKPGYDDVSCNVNIIGNEPQQFEIYKSKEIQFYSLQNNSDVNGATLYINDVNRGLTPSTISLPYGKYKVKMYYFGREKTGNLTVNDATSTTYRLTIPNSGHTRFNPFGIDYEARNGGIEVAWVQKWYEVKGRAEGSSSINYNYFGYTKHMNGFQVGLPFQPYFGYGLGMNTGLFFEGYFCEDSEYNQSLTEFDLYMPIDFQFRLPLAEQLSIYIQGGIGIDWSVAMKIYDHDYSESASLEYSEDGMPNRFNFSAEFGGGIQYKCMQLSAVYQLGLNNNSYMVYDDYTSKMRKLAIQLSFVF